MSDLNFSKSNRDEFIYRLRRVYEFGVVEEEPEGLKELIKGLSEIAFKLAEDCNSLEERKNT